MPLNPDLLAILCCPRCHGDLLMPDEDRLVCEACRLVYPIRDGIPIMLIDEAKPLEGETQRAD